MSNLNKLDANLLLALQAFEESGANHDLKSGIAVGEEKGGTYFPIINLHYVTN